MSFKLALICVGHVSDVIENIVTKNNERVINFLSSVINFLSDLLPV